MSSPPAAPHSRLREIRCNIDEPRVGKEGLILWKAVYRVRHPQTPKPETPPQRSHVTLIIVGNLRCGIAMQIISKRRNVDVGRDQLLLLGQHSPPRLRTAPNNTGMASAAQNTSVLHSVAYELSTTTTFRSGATKPAHYSIMHSPTGDPDLEHLEDVIATKERVLRSYAPVATKSPYF